MGLSLNPVHILHLAPTITNSLWLVVSSSLKIYSHAPWTSISWTSPLSHGRNSHSPKTIQMVVLMLHILCMKTNSTCLAVSTYSALTEVICLMSALGMVFGLKCTLMMLTQTRPAMVKLFFLLLLVLVLRLHLSEMKFICGVVCTRMIQDRRCSSKSFTCTVSP